MSLIKTGLKFILEVIIILAVVKFLIVPGVGKLIGVEQPIVVVMSGSMEHNNVTTWWEQHKIMYGSFGINEQQFKNFSFKNGINIGDLVVLGKPKDIKVGDVIVFHTSEKDLLHRVVTLNPLSTMGDANNGQISTLELNIPRDKIMGKAIFKIPLLGYFKLWLVTVIEKIQTLV